MQFHKEEIGVLLTENTLIITQKKIVYQSFQNRTKSKSVQTKGRE